MCVLHACVPSRPFLSTPQPALPVRRGVATHPPCAVWFPCTSTSRVRAALCSRRCRPSLSAHSRLLLRLSLFLLPPFCHRAPLREPWPTARAPLREPWPTVPHCESHGLGVWQGCAGPGCGRAAGRHRAQGWKGGRVAQGWLDGGMARGPGVRWGGGTQECGGVAQAGGGLRACLPSQNMRSKLSISVHTCAHARRRDEINTHVAPGALSW